MPVERGVLAVFADVDRAAHAVRELRDAVLGALPTTRPGATRTTHNPVFTTSAPTLRWTTREHEVNRIRKMAAGGIR
jgi:hypothetical protein